MKFQCIFIIVEVLPLSLCLILVYTALNIGPLFFFPALSHYLMISDIKNKCSSHCYFCDLTDLLLTSRASLVKHWGSFWGPSGWLLTVVCTLLLTGPFFFPHALLSLLAEEGWVTQKVMCPTPEEVVPMKNSGSRFLWFSHSLPIFLCLSSQPPHLFLLMK